jgi:hypothetical protein
MEYGQDEWGDCAPDTLLTICCTDQSGVLPIDAKSNCQDGQNVEKDYPEEGSLDRSRNCFMRLCRLSRSNGDQFDTTERVKCVNESLSEVFEAADECLPVFKI